MRRPCGARRGVQVPDAAHRRLPLAHPSDGVVQRRMPSVRSETCAHGLPKQFGEYSQAYSTTAGLSVHGVVSECTMALNGYSGIRRQTSTKAQPSPSLDLNALWGPQRSCSLTALPTAVQLRSKSIATANAVVSAVRVAMHVVQMLAAHATYIRHAACSMQAANDMQHALRTWCRCLRLAIKTASSSYSASVRTMSTFMPTPSKILAPTRPAIPSAASR